MKTANDSGPKQKRNPKYEYSASVSNPYSPFKKILQVIASTYIALLSVNIVISYLLKLFWGEPGEFWQHHWDKVLSLINNDTFNILVYAISLWTYLVYWTFGLMYTFLDVTGRPRFLYKYKIQSEPNEKFNKKGLLKVLLVVHFNQIITSTLVSITTYKVVVFSGYKLSVGTLPSFHSVIFEVIIFNLCAEFGFYYSHRLFHHPLLYKYFHKIHHECQAPIAITSVYAHPLEHVLSNLLPVFLGPAIMGSHMATVFLWFSLTIMNTMNDHSGYHFPFLPSAEFHDFHHLKFNQCFGIYGIFDYWHGTDAKFRRTKNFQRHKLMLSLTEPKIFIPDD